MIREASVCWRKGWAAVLPLGAAYGLIEEGLFAKTLIDPAQPQVGILGIAGRWLGLNWILVAAFLLFHALFSIALQILLTPDLPSDQGPSFPRPQWHDLSPGRLDLHRRAGFLCQRSNPLYA